MHIYSLETCYQAITELTAQNLTLINFSHVPTALAAIFVGLYVVRRSRQRLLAFILLGLTLSFASWSLLDLVTWYSIDARKIMGAWALLGVFDALFFFFSYYFVRVFITERDITSLEKILSVVIMAPLLLLFPTAFNLSWFDSDLCVAHEYQFYLNFTYFTESVFMLALLIAVLSALWKGVGRQKLQTSIVGGGTLLFLFIFFLIKFISDSNDDLFTYQYGLFGVVPFLASLAYLIVHYEAFHLKILAVDTLVLGLLGLVGAQFFFIENFANQVITIVVLIIIALFSFMLRQGVRLEIQRKEELQRISDDLATANEELRRLDNAKSEFISIASHQLRTPLTAIKGFVSLLLEGAYGKLEPTVADTLDKVYLANGRLMRLVENLLNISRIESGRIQYQFAPAQIESIITELKDIFILAAKNKGLDLVITLPSAPLPFISIDAAKIREVISNLIDNAIKYTNTGKVEVQVRAAAGGAEVQVSDTGMGMDAEDLMHLFGKFERGKVAANVNVSSTGLGLYIGKRFVEAHGGRIQAASPGPGQGACFTVFLPSDPKTIPLKVEGRRFADG